MSKKVVLGSALEDALSRGLDLVLARFIQQYGSLQALEQEIQRRVPDLPPPAKITLVNHVSQAADAASEMAQNPSEPLEDLSKIPVNEFLAARLEPGDRFLYTADVGAGLGADQPGRMVRVDIASAIPMSHDELKGLAADEIERRENDSPDVQIVGLPAPPAGWTNTDIAFDLWGAVRVY